MAKYRNYSTKQTRQLLVALSDQIQPGTIEYSINYLVDHHVNLSMFDSRYNNKSEVPVERHSGYQRCSRIPRVSLDMGLVQTALSHQYL